MELASKQELAETCVRLSLAPMTDDRPPGAPAKAVWPAAPQSPRTGTLRGGPRRDPLLNEGSMSARTFARIPGTRRRCKTSPRRLPNRAPHRSRRQEGGDPSTSSWEGHTARSGRGSRRCPGHEKNEPGTPDDVSPGSNAALTCSTHTSVLPLSWKNLRTRTQCCAHSCDSKEGSTSHRKRGRSSSRVPPRVPLECTFEVHVEPSK
mmetsp:Transcript_19830/g.53091  ORF Transcript_19830/g.53091 Transcript_19830/m.53091 type:complete len:206 (+) Transcript_19830:311-928(+)